MSLFKNIFGPRAAATTPPTPGKGASTGIVMQIVGEFTDRSRVEIKNWRDAIVATDDPERPRWVLLQDIYDNLTTDGHLSALLSLRKAATLANPFYIKDLKTGKDIPELTALLETEWFLSLLEHILDAQFRGFTVMELVDPTTMQWQLVPRRNCVPQKGMVLFESNGEKGISYRDPVFVKNVFEVQSINRLGILNNVIPQLIWKKNAQQAWADFSERFGIPLVTATTTKSDKASLDSMESSLRALGQAAQAVLPEGTAITIHDQVTKGDPHKVFQEQINTTNAEVSKALVGGTMITDNGSSKSQSEVHERTLDYKIAESDRRLVEFVVNGKVIPILRLWGFRFPDNVQFVFDRTEQLSLSDHWKIVEGALNYYEMDEAIIADTFNLPIVQKRQSPVETRHAVSQKPGASLSANFQ